ncbi:MAG: hypothetical protein MZW92_13605 [Comamonadaceae bacterium]|nr:hypothetical protein [Comamonadaceae bacterium]
MMRRMAPVAAVILAAGMLAGCENDAASYQIGGSSEHAITLIREQRYFWSPRATWRWWWRMRLNASVVTR